MRELDIRDLEIVGGAVDWGQVAAGLASVGLAVAIAGTPVGWVGAGAAAAAAYFGGVAIGDGLIEGDTFGPREPSVEVGPIEVQPIEQSGSNYADGTDYA